jgi:hypothetical protein
LNQLTSRCPSQKRGDVTVVFFKDHPVVLQPGEMLDIHWVDIQIELPRFRADNIHTAQKLLSANKEMGAASPIPSWFACGDKGEVLFVNRLDWRHVTAETLEDHIVRCIDQMNEALRSDGV